MDSGAVEWGVQPWISQKHTGISLPQTWAISTFFHLTLPWSQQDYLNVWTARDYLPQIYWCAEMKSSLYLELWLESKWLLNFGNQSCSLTLSIELSLMHNTIMNSSLITSTHPSINQLLIMITATRFRPWDYWTARRSYKAAGTQAGRGPRHPCSTSTWLPLYMRSISAASLCNRYRCLYMSAHTFIWVPTSPNLVICVHPIIVYSINLAVLSRWV